MIVGPAAAHFGWARTDYDALAGAIAAGHVIECGMQATGGNFSFFTELLDADPGCLDHIGFPLAEIAADGTAIITKHPGTGGAVTVETVTEQLLYELTASRYGGPDVVTRFDGLRLRQVARDRVEITGARGLPPGDWLKVATNRLGGFRNAMTLPLAGLDADRLALQQHDDAILSFRRAESLQPSGAAAAALGVSLYARGDYEAAIAAYRRAQGAGVGDKRLFNNLGLACRETGDFSSALGAFEHALKLDPRYAVA